MVESRPKLVIILLACITSMICTIYIQDSVLHFKQENPSDVPVLIDLKKIDCKPEQRLAFAKTHKTGGSTLQNVFLRYGYKNGLKFALPKRNWIYSLDDPINSDMVLKYPWNPSGTFDISVSGALKRQFIFGSMYLFSFILGLAWHMES